MIDKTAAWEPFRLIRWRPGIRGLRRWIDLRTLRQDGQLWFACNDVAQALHMSADSLRHRRYTRLDGNTWGSIRTQWQGRGHRETFLSLTALCVVLDRGRHRLDRNLFRWLGELEDKMKAVAVGGDHGDCEVD